MMRYIISLIFGKGDIFNSIIFLKKLYAGLEIKKNSKVCHLPGCPYQIMFRHMVIKCGLKWIWNILEGEQQNRFCWKKYQKVAKQDVFLKEGSKTIKLKCFSELIYKIMINIDTKKYWSSCQNKSIFKVSITYTCTNVRTNMDM